MIIPFIRLDLPFYCSSFDPFMNRNNISTHTDLRSDIPLVLRSFRLLSAAFYRIFDPFLCGIHKGKKSMTRLYQVSVLIFCLNFNYTSGFCPFLHPNLYGCGLKAYLRRRIRIRIRIGVRVRIRIRTIPFLLHVPFFDLSLKFFAVFRLTLLFRFRCQMMF